jgi:prepilin signal peptidase PulO-like enzyme (type II secretory pathway)
VSTLSTLPTWYWSIMGALLGGTIASFLGVVLERVPHGLSVNGRSRCACGRQLLWHENVPVLGWLRTGGTTSCCERRLPVSYLLGELAGMFGLGALGTLFGPVGIGVGASAAIAVVTVYAYLLRNREARPSAREGGR